MRKSHFTLPSPAMVVALCALFVALGGTGYAATQLGRSTKKSGKAATASGPQIRKVDFVRAKADGQNHQILNLDGLELVANCTRSDLFVTAYTTVRGAEVNAAIQTNPSRFDATDSNGDTYSQGDAYEQSSDLATSTGLDVVDYPHTAGESVSVHLEYANTKHQVVSVNFMSNQDALSSNVGCLVTGMAIGG